MAKKLPATGAGHDSNEAVEAFDVGGNTFTQYEYDSSGKPRSGATAAVPERSAVDTYETGTSDDGLGPRGSAPG